MRAVQFVERLVVMSLPHRAERADEVKFDAGVRASIRAKARQRVGRCRGPAAQVTRPGAFPHGGNGGIGGRRLAHAVILPACRP